ncbi:MAG: hypothetical protein ACK55I_49370, partial [bacterium]
MLLRGGSRLQLRLAGALPWRSEHPDSAARGTDDAVARVCGYCDLRLLGAAGLRGPQLLCSVSLP